MAAVICAADHISYIRITMNIFLKRISLFAFLILATTFISNAQGVEYEENQLVIKVDQSLERRTIDLFMSGGEFKSLVEEFSIVQTEQVFKSNNPALKPYWFVRHESGETGELMTKLSQLSWITEVERMVKYDLFFTPSDLTSQQWGLKKINAESAWDHVRGNRSVVIAVVDDAVYIDHEDIKDNVWKNSGEIAGNGVDDDGNGYVDDIEGWDSYYQNNDPRPNNTARLAGKQYHGTHVSAIAGGRTNNIKGMASLSFNVSLMPIKTSYINSRGSASLSTVALARGIEYAVVNKADVINMSWGGPGKSPLIQSALKVAADSGIVLVAAAGNSGLTPYGSFSMYPASYDNVISVGASNQLDKKTGFSNFNADIDVLAPGDKIYACLAKTTSSYGSLSGTSMASPMTAALAALILSKNPDLTPLEVESIIESTAVNVNALNPGFIGKIGSGRINADSAVRKAPAVIADFTVESQQACPSVDLQFSDLSRGANYTYKWSFPGGTPSASTAADPKVSYANTGTYDVTLIVTNLYGADTIEKKNYITIAKPSASLTSGKQTIIKGQSVTLQVKLTGRAPFTIAYKHGSQTDTLKNIQSLFYYITDRPDTNTTYELVFVEDADCQGTASGKRDVEVLENSGQLATICNDYKFKQKISDTQGDFYASFSGVDRFGTSSSNIGDLDGDGINDIAVGAHRKVFSGSVRGALYILFMTKDQKVKSYKEITSGLNGFTYSLAHHDHFGSSVSPIGDLDLDGVVDLAVGSVGEDDGAKDNGAIFILYMKKDGTVKSYKKISSTVGKVNGLTSGAHLGTGVKGVGDINGDGIPDVAASAAYQSGNRGAVFFLYLNRNGTVKGQNSIQSGNTNFVTLNTNVYFGIGITTVPDMDGNGRDELIVGSHTDDDGFTNAGSFYLIFPNTDGTVRKTIKFSNNSPGINNIVDASMILGRATEVLSTDGKMIRVVVTGEGHAGGRGSFWQMDIDTFGIVHDLARVDSEHTALSGRLDARDNFGYSIFNYIDSSGNKYIACGSSYDDDGGGDKGALYFISYKESPCYRNQSCTRFTYKQKISDTKGNFGLSFSGGDRFGVSSVVLGDLNSDGYQDIAVSAHKHTNTTTNAGAFFVLFLDSNQKVKSYKEIGEFQNGFSQSLDFNDGFGGHLTTIGDLDSNGVDEIVAAAAGDDDGGTDRGAVYILYMKADGTVKSYKKISSSVGQVTGLANGSLFGTDVSRMGDFNSDGVEDIAVGAYRHGSSGAIFILGLNKNGTVKSERRLTSGVSGMPTLDAGDQIGASLESVGDLDGNGVNDLLTGAIRDDDGASNAGAIYLLLMNKDGTVRKHVKYSGTTLTLKNNIGANTYFGQEIKHLYTINGMSRIVVSASGYKSNQGGAWMMDIDTFGNVYKPVLISKDHDALKNITDIGNQTWFGHTIDYIENNNGLEKYLVLGAGNDNDGGTDRGAIHFIRMEDTCSMDTTQCMLNANLLVNLNCLHDGSDLENITIIPTDVIQTDIQWDMGDGVKYNGINKVKHVYSAAGTYPVTMIVRGQHLLSRNECADTLNYSLVVSDTIIYSMKDRDTMCVNDSLTLSVDDIKCAGAPFTYTWTPNTYIDDPGSATPNVSPPSSQWYYVKVQTATQTINDSIYIHVDPVCCVSHANFTADRISVCLNDTVRLTNLSEADDATVSYDWIFGSKANIPSYSGKNPPPIVMDEAGLDTVTLILRDKCSIDTAQLEIWVNPLPQLNEFNDTAVCAGDTVWFDMRVWELAEYYTWQPQGILEDTLGDNPYYIATADQTFIITLNNSLSGCEASDTVEIIAKPYPVVDLGKDTTVCENESVRLVSNVRPALYKWSDNSTDSAITVTSPGLYWLEVDLNGCKDRDSIQVNHKPLPKVELGNDTSICHGDSLVLDASYPGASYLWNDLSTNSSVTAKTTGTYKVTLTLNGCEASDSIDIVVMPLPKVDLIGDTALCEGDTITLQAVTPGTYLWSDLSTNSYLDVTSAGTYWLRITIGKCSASDTVNIRQIELPGKNLGADITACDTVDMNIGPLNDPDLRYLWSTGDTVSRIHINKDGTYWLRTTRENCSSVDSINIILNHSPKISLGEDTTVCQGIIYRLNVAASNADEYLWQDGSNEDNLGVTSSGIYTLRAGKDGCFSSDTVIIEFINCECYVLYPTAFSPNADNLNDTYKPEPVCDIEDLHFSIYNRLGVVVFFTNDVNKAWDGYYKGEVAMQGVYAVEYYYTIIDHNGLKRQVKDHSKVLLLKNTDD